MTTKRWVPVQPGIHSLRFGDRVDIQRLDTGDWRAEILRDDEVVITCYPPQTLQLCVAIDDPAPLTAEVVKAIQTIVGDCFFSPDIEPEPWSEELEILRSWLKAKGEQGT